MRAPAQTDTAFELRKHRIWKTLAGRHGEVVLASDDRSTADSRRLEFDVALPGYRLPRVATLSLVETWQRSRGRWRLAEYLFDYHLEPRGSGRRAHHLHDGTIHAHCEDPVAKHAHYRDVEVELLEAAAEFGSYFAIGSLTCAGLFPL